MTNHPRPPWTPGERLWTLCVGVGIIAGFTFIVAAMNRLGV